MDGWGWLLVILVLLIVAIVIWWWWRKRSGAETGAAPASVRPTPLAGGMADDLQKVEGIGPKISELLAQNGIASFAQLAAADVKKLQSILQDAGINIADPTTWPEQARLAAQGK